HAGDDASASGRILAEILPENLIKRLKITRVVEPHTATHYVLRSVARFCQDRQKIPHCLMRLRNDTACDEFAIDHRHLARYVQPAIGFDSAGKGQGLTSGAFASFSAVTLYAHRVCSSLVAEEMTV